MTSTVAVVERGAKSRSQPHDGGVPTHRDLPPDDDPWPWGDWPEAEDLPRVRPLWQRVVAVLLIAGMVAVYVLGNIPFR